MTVITSDKVQHDKYKLASFEAAFSAAKEDRDSARKSVADAVARLEACEELISSIENEMLALRSAIDIDERRLQACRRQLTSLPVELLCAVFRYISSSPDPLWKKLGEGKYSHERATRPFHLAAVCKRWQQVAQTSPELWTYLGIPVQSSTMKIMLHVQRINIIIKRSERRPLDVLFNWSMSSAVTLGIGSHGQTIFNALAQVVHRWGTFEFSAPRSVFTRDRLDVFRHPTPMLRRLAIAAPVPIGLNEDWRGPFTVEQDLRPCRYFPVAPLLEEFSSEWTNVQINSTPHSLVLGRLRSLKTVVGPAATRWLWQALRAAPGLHRLALWAHNCSEDSPDLDFVQPASELCLASLVELNLAYDSAVMLSRASPLLKFPSLKRLVLPERAVGVLVPTVLASSGSVITHITLDSECIDDGLGASDAETLHSIASLQRLTLDGVDISADFFDVLSQPLADGTWLVPKLTSLELNTCTFVGDVDSTGVCMVHFVQARTRSNANVSRLRDVSIDEDTNLKLWHREEICLLMGDDSEGLVSLRSS